MSCVYCYYVRHKFSKRSFLSCSAIILSAVKKYAPFRLSSVIIPFSVFIFTAILILKLPLNLSYLIEISGPVP